MNREAWKGAQRQDKRKRETVWQTDGRGAKGTLGSASKVCVTAQVTCDACGRNASTGATRGQRCEKQCRGVAGSESVCGMAEKEGTHGRGQSCYEEFKGEKIHGSREQEGRAGGLRPGESPPTLGRAADRQATRTEGGITGIVTPPQPP